ncbi:branched-chain amino acid ABC transporter permease [Rhodococcus ruber Chol-4]|uniref:Similar to ABC-type branched-chain amino acid transport systems periplasmic component n=1 Tax=Rhodococcus ruber TaxID=1830 RepID=A0A098BIF7_9NOCA|nr:MULTISPECIES: ABC transporter substrate-binding protein [Rhodococcus]MDO2377142.1 ABC transporter substrate-binding protein [Rhodococcus ruber]RIK04166.1 MAG: amino acid ABC transporter substrate-binding protein [Acidobacteriota bacterium]ATQ29812.1 amino acid ABC transporter substrate-binding protein [Rhodococcus ruber]AUM18833.1 amino acid ABC transporter substrate-binding protein [Rhodococcus ruber]AWH01226.1 amino acid ABC transporter substrate-binding protein [Rhodococcus ruber]
MSRVDRKVRRRLLGAASAFGVLFAAACSSGGNSTVADGDLPAEIKVVSVTDQTGTTAYVGNSQLRGIELAIQEINDQEYLGDSKIVLQKRDSASDTQTAVSQATEALTDKSVSALLGPVLSAHAVAIAPLVERAGLPTIFTQSGSEGVVIGDYTYRATAPMETYFVKALERLQQQGVETVSVLYNAGNVTLAGLGEKTIPEGQDKYGYRILSSTSVQATTQDFGTTATKIAGENPDAVIVLLVGAGNSTAMSQLRQAGYTGPVVGNPAAGAGNLAPAGAAGAGMYWATDFSFHQKDETSQQFVEAYRAKYNGENPLNYAAEGYDATWMLAHAAKNSGGASRDDLQRGLEQVVAEGFDGALGPVRFEGNDMRVDGVLVEWNGTEEVLLDGQESTE